MEQLHDALFQRGTDARACFHRQLSQRLVALWATAHPPSSDMLLRVLPPPLLRYLSSSEVAPVSETNALLAKRRSATGSGGPKERWWRVGRTKRQIAAAESFRARTRDVRVEKGPTLNWMMLWHQTWEDHTRPNLLWNQRTREELREALA